MRFRPCIDLHQGKVKQIVGSTLRDDGTAKTNFVSDKSPAFYASLYNEDGLSGGHVIMLGPGNEDAAKQALSAAPGTLQVGGGLSPDNCARWLDAGASHVIVTSWLFTDGELNMDRLAAMSRAAGRNRLVLDLSCILVEGEYHVACNRWQDICKYTLSQKNLASLADYCDELLVHAVGMEGKQGGIDAKLVSLLAQYSPMPVTYAGGISSMEDIELLNSAGNGRVDFTVGSALDIFGGALPYKNMLVWRN